MAASRLPGKPLADIGGQPMIVRVMRVAEQAAMGPVAVACAEAAIADAVRAAGGTAVLTNPELPSGSDRVHAALAALDPDHRHDVVVNLQGDLPSLPPADLRAVLEPLRDGDAHIGTLVAPVADADEAERAQVVKAVCDFGPGQATARAWYFSRARVPWGDGPCWHHVGVYAWRRDALERFVRLPPSGLEQRERLEQLRALEAGMVISCARVGAAPRGVDTEDDLSHARHLFAAVLVTS